MSKIRVGVIGCGRISVMHLSSIKALENLELVAVCDIKRERADEAAEKYGNAKVLRDGVHPTVEGAVILANEWIKVFEKIK